MVFRQVFSACQPNRTETQSVSRIYKLKKTPPILSTTSHLSSFLQSQIPRSTLKPIYLHVALPSTSQSPPPPTVSPSTADQLTVKSVLHIYLHINNKSNPSTSFNRSHNILGSRSIFPHHHIEPHADFLCIKIPSLVPSPQQTCEGGDKPRGRGKGVRTPPSFFFPPKPPSEPTLRRVSEWGKKSSTWGKSL